MYTKKCSKCGEWKTTDNFHKDSKKNDGLFYCCKQCLYEKRLKYRRTKEGVVDIIYHNQINSSKHRRHHLPMYSQDELRDWLFHQPLFHDLYDDWVKYGYDRWMKPSVDRIDDYLGYSFDNIQLMTWKQNDEKGAIDMFYGVNTKKCKAVLQYDLNGNFIKEYPSASIAMRYLNISCHISDVCKGYRHTCGGYIWKYKNN